MQLQIKKTILPHFFLLIFVLLLSVPIVAQETANEEATASEETANAEEVAASEESGPEEAPAPLTTDNPDISIEALQFRLKPLTQDQLKAEADGWLAIVQDKVQQISELQVQALEAEDAAKSQLQDQISQLQEERTKLIDRLNAVLKSLQTKGGDIETYEKYVTAVSGIDVNTKDVGGMLIQAKNWLLSPEGGIRWAINIGLFVGVLIVFQILAKLAGRAMGRVMNRTRNTSALLKNFAVNVAQKLVFFLGLLVALSMLEVNIGPFLAALGAVGFIVGFALQGTLGNFAAGVMILLYRPYDIGDYVSVAGSNGTVEDMSLVSTTLRLPDNQIVIVPNGKIWDDIITNVTGVDKRRVDLVFGIGYDDDIQQAQEVLERVVNEHELVLKDPAPVIRVHELADSSVNFIVRPWSKTSDYWTVYWDLTRAVKERFDEAGISIPYPQQDVHFRQSDASPPAKKVPSTPEQTPESGFAKNDEVS